jgi:alpha-beta hydrolase superfamily lysophospholipase
MSEGKRTILEQRRESSNCETGARRRQPNRVLVGFSSGGATALRFYKRIS